MYSQMDTERSVPFVCSEAAEESYQKCILKNNKTLVYRSGASSIIVFTEISPCSALVDNGKKHVIEQLNSVSAGPEQLYGKSEGISEYLLPLEKTKALINSWVSQWTHRRDLAQPNKVVTSGRALPGSAHMGLSRARRPILVSLQPGHGAAHTPTGTWAFPQAMWYGSSWEDAALPLNQETRTKWPEWNIYGWAARIFSFSSFRILSSSSCANASNSAAISEFRARQRSPGEDAEVQEHNPTQLISSALLGRGGKAPTPAFPTWGGDEGPRDRQKIYFPF